MDLMTIDLRGHPDARAGDPVVLWGVGLPIESVEEASGTIAYELSCSITRRVRFVVVSARTWARWPFRGSTLPPTHAPRKHLRSNHRSRSPPDSIAHPVGRS